MESASCTGMTGDKQSDDGPSGKQKLCRSEKKRRLREENNRLKKALRKEKKQQRKVRLRQADDNDSDTADKLSKKEMRAESDRRCRQAMVDGQRVCVDLSVEDHMTDKEKSKVAQQLGRLYGANRKSPSPFHVYFAGVSKHGQMYKECVRKNDGFQNYLVEMCESPLTQLFSPEEMVYLTPDAADVLTSLDKSKVYVIGGFVDESIKKNVTWSKCESSGIRCKRLPITEFMERQPGLVRYSSVLALNQVFEILLRFHETGDWRLSLSEGVPKRNGYMLKTDSNSSLTTDFKRTSRQSITEPTGNSQQISETINRYVNQSDQ